MYINVRLARRGAEEATRQREERAKLHHAALAVNKAVEGQQTGNQRCLIGLLQLGRDFSLIESITMAYICRTNLDFERFCTLETLYTQRGNILYAALEQCTRRASTLHVF